MQTMTNSATRLTMRGLLDGLETDPTEQQILTFIKKKIKGGTDAVEKEKIISALEAQKVLGRRAINAIWKVAVREIAKPKGIGKWNVDVEDDFHTGCHFPFFPNDYRILRTRLERSPFGPPIDSRLSVETGARSAFNGRRCGTRDIAHRL